MRDDFAAVDACAGANIDDIIGGHDRVLVMLHHDDAVAEIAQASQCLKQARIVALMKADGGFIQYIENAGEA